MFIILHIMFIVLHKDVFEPVSHPEGELIHFIISTVGDICAKQESFCYQVIC